MRIRSALLLALASAIIWAFPVSAQVATGTPPFGSFSGGPDIINNANLNVHLTIPVLHKSGRGMSFNYDLTYDNSIWYPVGTPGSQTWQLNTAGTWGWNRSVSGGPGGGHVTHSTLIEYKKCPDRTTLLVEFFSNWAYIDGFGTRHSFAGTSELQSGDCHYSQTSFESGAADGSGYTISVTGAGVSSLVARDGMNINAWTGSGYLTDRNGNEITTSTSGGTTSYFDTLSSTTPVLTWSGAGTPSSPYIFAYIAPSGASAPYTVKYVTYSIQTSFGCSGISEYGANGTTTANLVSEIDLPDDNPSGVRDRYVFSYEPTPGHSGYFTGRIASVALPTGGTINYSYSGGSNGIVCSDGSTATLTRTTPDGTWQYAHSESGTASTTTVTDPQNNQTVLNFQGIYETERQIYQGAATGTPLKTVYTCYNSATAPCNSTAITLPITQRAVTLQWPSGLESKTVTSYNSYGLVTERDEYDYGGVSPVRKTVIGYASLGNGIVDKPASVAIYDGSGGIKAQTTYTYDQSGDCCQPSSSPNLLPVSGSRGNATTITSWVSSSASPLTKTYSYYDNGNIYQFHDVNGALYTYGYDGSGGCGSSFATSITEPITPLSKSFSWNCTGGVQLTTTDENGQTVTANYTNADFWRPDSVQDQMSPPNTTNLTYNGQISVESTLNFSSSTTDVLATLDGLGRVHLTQQKQGPSSGTYDSVQTTYDPLGRPSSVTLPYSAGIGTACSGSCPGTMTTYDPLGRPTAVTDSGGLNTTYQYNANDVYETVGPLASGDTNTKRKQYEYDALGRLTSVCEITNANGSGPCGQNTAATGFATQYTYDALGDLTKVTQGGGAQTRSYNYDGLGRMTSETNPESGVTSYSWDSDSTCSGTYAGDLVKKLDAAGNTTCYSYDAMHRMTSMTVPSGPNAANTASRWYFYDTPCCGYNLTNTKGRLWAGHTCPTASPCSANIVDELFSYDARGEITDFYEHTPNSGDWYHVTESYWPNGAPDVLSGVPGLATITYAPDGEGRVSTVSASSGQNPVTNTTYNAASQPLAVNFGSGDSDAFQYDTMDRMDKYTFTVNGQLVIGSPTWNANGSLGSLAMTDPFNSANAQNCSYTHDDLARLSNASCSGSGFSGSYTYDAFGNLNKGGTDIFDATYNSSTNQMATIGSQTPSYDADGNILDDYLNTYSWDGYGRPVVVNGVDITYDAFGRMVERNNGGSYSQVLYAPTGAKIAVMSGQSLDFALVPLAGGAVAEYHGGGTFYYRHPDWIGSSRFVSTTTQTMYSDGAYGPFGEPYAGSGTSDLMFTGMDQDTSPNVYDFPAREYGIQGRWPSTDPAGLAAVNPMDPQTWNRYAYVRNSPLSMTDPTGMGPHGCQARSGGRLGMPRAADCGNGCADSDLNCIFGGGGGGGGVDAGGGGGGACEWYDPTCGPPNGCDFLMGDTCNPKTGQNCDIPGACWADGTDPSGLGCEGPDCGPGQSGTCTDASCIGNLPLNTNPLVNNMEAGFWISFEHDVAEGAFIGGAAGCVAGALPGSVIGAAFGGGAPGAAAGGMAGCVSVGFNGMMSGAVLGGVTAVFDWWLFH
ncbi:MAG: RHS repeat-associated core domain-containing protein [Candidatus Acidiferrales bacterium]